MSRNHLVGFCWISLRPGFLQTCSGCGSFRRRPAGGRTGGKGWEVASCATAPGWNDTCTSTAQSPCHRTTGHWKAVWPPLKYSHITPSQGGGGGGGGGGGRNVNGIEGKRGYKPCSPQMASRSKPFSRATDKSV